MSAITIDIYDPTRDSLDEITKILHRAYAPRAICCHTRAAKTWYRHKLVKFIESRALQDGKKELACDTAESAIQLIDFYKRRSYYSIGFHQWSHACIILAKTLGHIQPIDGR